MCVFVITQMQGICGGEGKRLLRVGEERCVLHNISERQLCNPSPGKA